MPKQRNQTTAGRLYPWLQARPPRGESGLSFGLGLLSLGIGICLNLVVVASLLGVSIGPEFLIHHEPVPVQPGLETISTRTSDVETRDVPSVVMFLCVVAGMGLGALGIHQAERSQPRFRPVTSIHGLIVCSVSLVLMTIHLLLAASSSPG